MNLIGQIYGNMGIPNHTRDLFSELLVQIPGSKVYPTHSGGNFVTSAPLAGAITGWPTDGTKLTGDTFIFWTPDIYAQVIQRLDRSKSFVIGYPIFEWTNLSPEWIAGLKLVDLIAVSSKWARAVIIAHGFSEDKVVVLPAGVSNGYLGIPAGKDATKKFLFVAKNEVRKSVKEVLTICAEELPKYGQRLTALISDPHDPSFNARALLSSYGISQDAPIDLISPPIGVGGMVNLYDDHEFLLMPSKAGGTELPILEAIARGCTPIYTEYSGMTEIQLLPDVLKQWAPHWSIPVKKLVPMQDNRWFKPYREWGVWAEPDWDAFRARLKEASEEDMREQQCQDRAFIRFHAKQFAYPRIVGKFIEVLNDSRTSKG
jgi:hypothetical protein